MIIKTPTVMEKLLGKREKHVGYLDTPERIKRSQLLTQEIMQQYKLKGPTEFNDLIGLKGNQVNQVLDGSKGWGITILRKIARATHRDEEELLRFVGWLPPKEDIPNLRANVIRNAMDDMTEEDQQLIVDYVNMIYQRREKENKERRRRREGIE